MARINAIGWDDLYKQVRAAGKKTPETMEKMIEKGAKVYEDITKAQIDAFELVDTGAMRAAVKAGKIERIGDGLRIEVWPQGRRVDRKHPKGERNETIAFVTEYGRSGVTAQPFMSAAAEIAVDLAYDQMMIVLEQEQSL